MVIDTSKCVKCGNATSGGVLCGAGVVCFQCVTREMRDLDRADHFDFRGWRFFAPFFCFRCGRVIAGNQFAFSRSCGGCDVSDSKTSLLRLVDHRVFVGKVEKLPDWGNRSSDIDPQWLPVNSEEAQKLMDAGPRHNTPSFRPLPRPPIPPDRPGVSMTNSHWPAKRGTR